jgi:mitochondrial import inner membrane translocase subunit TIM54
MRGSNIGSLACILVVIACNNNFFACITILGNPLLGMSTQDAGPAAAPAVPTAAAPAKRSGFRVALEYTGIPVSWLSKRPKLPSRNWLIFWSVTSALTGYYFYDRRECKRIRREYVDKVKYLSEVTPTDHFALPRKVAVYGCKWPGDEDYDQTVKYFKKYIKVCPAVLIKSYTLIFWFIGQPILVSAAVDYEIVNGKRHGDLANKVADAVRSRRRIDLGLDHYRTKEELPPNYPYRSLDEVRKHELEGGIVLLGRPAFKEFMAGLKRGWTEGVNIVDKDQLLAEELEQDGRFDDLPDPAEESATPQTLVSDEEVSPSSPTPVSPVMLALQTRQGQSPFTKQTQAPGRKSAAEPEFQPPSAIPPLPPLLLVPFIDYIGFRQVPIMIWDWFNHRHKVRSGAETAYRLVQNSTRPIQPPPLAPAINLEDSPSVLNQGPDLNFDVEKEKYVRANKPAEIEKARKEYYNALPKKLKVARELARGEREPTKEEVNNPPPT